MQRVHAIMAHPDFQIYMALNEQQEINREFCCHQLQHALDVARIYYILCLEANKEKPLPELREMNGEQVKELVYAAGLLHDIGRWKQYLDKSLDHAEEGAALAKPILQDAGFTPEEIKIAIDAIRAHRDAHAAGMGKVLYRADKLSRNCTGCKAKDKCYKLSEMETLENILY
ncbi:HD domain-containing protein [Candidatus Formimonas warabiya]|uniref:HD domain-containing protein n=1 Tax=Formimonas warabiya TaxID=1761012 RepID=A0A3G1KWZ3_FORW1|nr:HD domain-containing protein [Candidatus Formimonas warabiya]ATW27053.1 hypothetical protein DCMF_21855 [Candidatus Formimonas warabiya]